MQFDEPSLPAALAGRLTGVTSLSPVHPVDEAVVTELLDECVAVVGGDVAVHSCAAGLPWKLLQRSMIAAVSVDVHTLTAADLDGVGEFVGVGPDGPAGRGADHDARDASFADQIAATVAGVTDRLGFARARAARPNRCHSGLRARRCDAGVGAHGDRAGAAGRRRVCRGI